MGKNKLSKDRGASIVSYEARLMDRELYGRQEGIKKGREEGLIKLIRYVMKTSNNEDAVFDEAKDQYGEYFTDDQLREFIAQAKGKTLQEA